MRWIIAVGITAEWRTLFYTLGTQHSNTAVAQQACRSSCYSSPPLPSGAGSWCNTSIRDNIIRTPHTLSFVSMVLLWFRCGTFNPEGMGNSLCSVFGGCAFFASGLLLCNNNNKMYLWLVWRVSHQLEFPLQLEHPRLTFSLVFVLPQAHLNFFLYCICFFLKYSFEVITGQKI